MSVSVHSAQGCVGCPPVPAGSALPQTEPQPVRYGRLTEVYL
jgi:hypothetical protein